VVSGAGFLDLVWIDLNSSGANAQISVAIMRLKPHLPMQSKKIIYSTVHHPGIPFRRNFQNPIAHRPDTNKRMEAGSGTGVPEAGTTVAV